MGQADAWGASDDLQFADFSGLLRARARDAQRALLQLAPEEDKPAGRLLPVLRGLEPAVRDPAVGVDRRRLVGGAMDGARQAGSNAQAVDDHVGGRESRHARLLQIWRVP